MYSKSNFTKSPASGTGNVSGPRLISQDGIGAKSCARRLVSFFFFGGEDVGVGGFCNRSCGCAIFRLLT